MIDRTRGIGTPMFGRLPARGARPPTGLVTSLLLALGLPAAVLGQEATPEDVASIDAIITAYYEVVSGPAGEAQDKARDLTLHHPEAWVAIAGEDASGNRMVNVMTLEEYHGDGAPRSQPFYEWETDRRVQRSGNMVHVWSSYAAATSPDGEPFDTGVNSITLFHDGNRWWIMGWMFDASAEQGHS